MDNVLIFAGTTEGRRLAEYLAENQVCAHVCVATKYGEQLLPESPYICIHAGRIDQEEMRGLMEREQIKVVVDATHPYAVLVSENIRRACQLARVNKAAPEYIRLERGTSGESMDDILPEDVVFADSVQDAADFLAKQEGKILAATGSKELAAYTVIPGYKERVFARVLSTAQVAVQCAKLGFEGKNLICMQGPFSEELNTALLRQTGARWMVTKEAGKEGGFEDKLRAARNAGARLVLVKRPTNVSGGKTDGDAKESGYACVKGSETEVRQILCRRLGFHPYQRVSLVGIGMGAEGTFTVEGARACQEAELLIGAGRMLEAVDTSGKTVLNEYRADKIASYVCKHPEYRSIAVLLSGDIGFYSGAKGIYEAFAQEEPEGRIEWIPCCGISSVVYFCGKLRTSWEDAFLLSMHGRKQNLIAAIRKHAKVFALCGEKGGVNAICRKLVFYGMGSIKVSVGTDLSYPEEQIITGTAEELADRDFAGLSVLLLENPDADRIAVHGLEDEAFLRGKVPMTKSEVRSISLSKLRLPVDAVVYDIGAGTGSVSVETALAAREGQVYAVEKKKDAIVLLEENKRKFAADNLTIIEGLAPAALFSLPAPTHAFIGGSSGNLREIMELLLKKNPCIRIVINAIALETISEALQCLKMLPVKDVDIVSVSVGKSKEAGTYHMMMGQNPVYIISCTGDGDLLGTGGEQH